MIMLILLVSKLLSHNNSESNQLTFRKSLEEILGLSNKRNNMKLLGGSMLASKMFYFFKITLNLIALFFS